MIKLLTTITLSMALATGAVAAEQQRPSATPAAKDSKTIYCMTVEPMTGSRIGKNECHTKAEWARIGVDIDEVLGK
jgi:hypothetical protein